VPRGASSFQGRSESLWRSGRDRRRCDDFSGDPKRYHKAIEISRPEPDFIIKKWSRSDVVVLSRSDKWYDVRALAGKEVDDFVADLVRADMANLRAGCVTPH
jgi:hypothetical protein